jgi:RHS repeat-associated protein
VRSVSDEQGNLEDRYEYDAFGKPYLGDLEHGMNRGYTGKPYDTATGLYNYGYRDYQPEAARFTTTDPIRDGANWFSYVNNDPVNYTDPWGLECSPNDKKTQDKIDALATGPINKIDPARVVIDNSIGWQYVGDKSKIEDQYESLVQRFSKMEDYTVTVKDKEYTGRNIPTNPTGVQKGFSMQGTEYAITFSEDKKNAIDFHDINNDGWLDYVFTYN